MLLEQGQSTKTYTGTKPIKQTLFQVDSLVKRFLHV
jgi:hypothetical protein